MKPHHLLHVVVLTAALILSQIWLPWWVLGLVCWGWVLMFKLSGGRAILTASLVSGLVWLIPAFYVSELNEHLLVGRMAKVFGFNSAIYIWCLMFAASALGAALSTSAAIYMNKIFKFST